VRFCQHFATASPPAAVPESSLNHRRPESTSVGSRRLSPRATRCLCSYGRQVATVVCGGSAFESRWGRRSLLRPAGSRARVAALVASSSHSRPSGRPARCGSALGPSATRADGPAATGFPEPTRGTMPAAGEEDRVHRAGLARVCAAHRRRGSPVRGPGRRVPRGITVGHRPAGRNGSWQDHPRFAGATLSGTCHPFRPRIISTSSERVTTLCSRFRVDLDAARMIMRELRNLGLASSVPTTGMRPRAAAGSARPGERIR
jgi:hypothetical protein